MDCGTQMATAITNDCRPLSFDISPQVSFQMESDNADLLYRLPDAPRHACDKRDDKYKFISPHPYAYPHSSHYDTTKEHYYHDDPAMQDAMVHKVSFHFKEKRIHR